ncbi:hypothetical protein PR202_ga15541 [Eleusine coracana subsp. coracana]|uniref:Pentatricopeptide repeat-containing protein n=1 Tax=Eleusine coracana subsp. coracana TaxID=191504 RepID=A0AAV5CKE7_ELECO|nr:hypothetical protein PR202_ga15541 [Eleusine coracana subsp. coracana]
MVSCVRFVRRGYIAELIRILLVELARAGNKAATHEHDFLSLYTPAAAAKDSPLQLHAESKPPPPLPSQGFLLRTHDFLQPLAEKKPGEETSPSPSSGADAIVRPVGVAIKQHALPLPGGVGTFSIRPAAPVVKAEPPLVLWGQPTTTHTGGRAGQHLHWTLPFAGAGQVRPLQPERKGPGGGGGGTMDSGSRSSGGAGFDDDDGLAARREVSSSLKELTVRKRPSSVGEMSLHALMAPGAGSQWHPTHVHQLHAHLLVSGRLAASSAAALALLRAAFRVRASPCLHPLARHLLDGIPRPTPHLLHAAARLAHHLRLPSLAFRHYLALRDHHPSFLPPAPAIADVLKSIPGRAAHAQALRVAAHAVDARFLDNTLIAMYFACGDAWSARQVFEGMCDRDVVSWTSLISGLVQNGCPLQGLHHFVAMMRCEVHPDFVLLVSVLKACMELDDFPCAAAAHSLVIKSGFDNELDVVITLTAMYARFGYIVAARELFDRVPSPWVNVILWNAMISGYSKNGLASEAVHLFKRMRMVARSMTPDSVTLLSVILACAQLGSLELAQWMEDYVQGSEYRDDVLVNTALIDMFAKSGNIAHAHAVFQRINVRDRDVVVWSALIGGYGVHGHVKEAVALFEDMKLTSVKPNDVTFLGLLSACNHAGAVEKGWSYFQSMKHEYGIEPRHQHYACIVDLLARAGQLDRAYRFIMDMPIKPEMSVWGAFLHGCKMHGHSNMTMAECAAQHIFELERSNAGHYVQLANLYASAGMWNRVDGVRVIEYIRFLQEKVTKYEATFPEWNQENAKIIPWSKGQIPGDALPDPSQFLRNGSSPRFNFTGKLDDNHNTVTSVAASGAQDQAETDHMARMSYRSTETPTNITNNATSQCQTQWTDPSPVNDCAVNSEMLNNQQLAIDEGTISVSSQYSQELLNSLTQALQSSGIDLSQASISVQINLGKRAVKRPGAGDSSNSKETTETQPSSNYETDRLIILSSLPSGEALKFRVHYVSCDGFVVNETLVYSFI